MSREEAALLTVSAKLAESLMEVRDLPPRVQHLLNQWETTWELYANPVRVVPYAEVAQ